MQECKLKKCGDCEHYDVLDRYCEMKHDTRRFGAVTEACEYFADAKEISDIIREAETVPVVTEQAETEHDAVEHPNHYTSGGIECIDCIKAALGQNFIGFLMGNVIKYSYRYRNKNGLEDLKKARWYLDRAIKEIGDERTE